VRFLRLDAVPRPPVPHRLPAVALRGLPERRQAAPGPNQVTHARQQRNSRTGGLGRAEIKDIACRSGRLPPADYL